VARRLPLLPALDGIRAIAVVAVLLYHADLIRFLGGFLGVEVFFVLSGYLITSLLLAEHRSTERIAIGAFYVRRARRLLPAVFLMLFVVTVAFVIGWPEEVGRIRGDVLAAFTYVSNWYLIGIDHSYFAQLGRPSPFGHLWSLAIEEQFYLLWPLMLSLLAARFRSDRDRAVWIAGAIGLSFAAMALLFRPGDPTRAYFGTDTRASGLLIGALLAVVWRPWDAERRTPTIAPWMLDAAALGSLGVLLWTFMRWDEFADFTFRPGLAVVSVATAVLIAACVHPAARVTRVLALPPMRWLGHRSYAIYLWHWPVFVVTRPGVDYDISIMQALAPRLAVTLLLADLSYRFVEKPIRAGLLGRTARRIRERAHASPVALRGIAYGWSTIMTVSVLSLAMLAGALVRAQPPVADAAVPGLDPRPRPVATRDAPGDRKRTRKRAIPWSDVVRVPSNAFGDSVMLGARGALKDQFSRIRVNAAVSRQAWHVPALIRQVRREGNLRAQVIIHVGNNGYFLRSHFDTIMGLLGDTERVLFLTVKVPRSWEARSNQTIAEGVTRYDNAEMVDWHKLWRQCEVDVFTVDAFHMTRAGARCYARLIATTF